jgi:DNA polymerase-3 subunit gamma/tau
LQAAEMVLIRIAHAAELPSPDDLVRILGGNGQRRPQDAAGQRSSPGDTQTARLHSHAAPQDLREGPSSVPEPSLEEPGNLADVARLAGHHRDARLKVHLEEHVSLVRFEPGRIEINLLDGAPPGLAGELGEKLGRWTGRRWIVAVSREPGAPPIAAVRRQQAAAEIADIKTHPAVQTLLEVFPEAEIKEVRPLPGPQDESATG